MSDARPSVETRIEGAVATILFNRPDRLNALDLDMATRFGEAVETCLAARDLRVIVLASEGRAFVAGGDLTYFDEAADKARAAEILVGAMHAPLKRLAASDRITIGSAKGPVAGAGMSLALGLDILVAAEDTVFNFAYTRIGTSVDCGGSWSLPRLVGLRRALEIALCGETIDAARAEELGMVNAVVPLDRLEAETMRRARRIAEGAPVAHGEVKRLMRTAFERDYDAHLDAELRSFAACAGTADFANAVSAFLNKTRHRFEGR